MKVIEYLNKVWIEDWSLDIPYLKINDSRYVEACLYFEKKYDIVTSMVTTSICTDITYINIHIFNQDGIELKKIIRFPLDTRIFLNDGNICIQFKVELMHEKDNNKTSIEDALW